MVLCAKAWERVEYNTSDRYWRSTCQLTMAAIDSANRCMNEQEDRFGTAATSFPITQIVTMLAKPDECCGVSVAVELCSNAPTAAVANHAWRFSHLGDLRRTIGMVLRGQIPAHRYRNRSVRQTMLSGCECVQQDWAEAFDRPRAVEDVAVLLLIDAAPEMKTTHRRTVW